MGKLKSYLQEIADRNNLSTLEEAWDLHVIRYKNISTTITTQTTNKTEKGDKNEKNRIVGRCNMDAK